MNKVKVVKGFAYIPLTCFDCNGNKITIFFRHYYQIMEQHDGKWYSKMRFVEDVCVG